MQAPCIGVCGFSGAGKTTSVYLLRQRLAQSGHAAFVLDGDNLWAGLCTDLGFHRSIAVNPHCTREVTKILSAIGQIPHCSLHFPLK